jgi:hypothetical protein
MDTDNTNGTPDNQGAPGGEEVNFDALAAPEGGYDPIVNLDNEGGGDGEDPIPGDSGIPGSLPNLDGEMDKAMGNNAEEPQGGDPNPDPDNVIDPNAGDPNAGDPGGDPNPEGGGENQENYWMKPFEQLKEANPEWEIPEGINEENYLQMLQQVLKPQEQKEFHPELLKMQEALDSGTSFEKIVETFQQSSDLMKMSDRDLLAENYKHHYKDWDEAKVSSVLDKLDNAGMLEIEAGKLRNAITENQSQESARLQVEEQKAYAESVAQMNTERTKQINESLDIINKAEDIYGLPISQAEKTEFSKYFSELVTPDPKTGQAPMMEMLQSNDTLVKVAMMMWKGDDKVRSALTDAKESGKDAILGKLDKKPQSPRRGGGQGDPTKIDMDALAAPERIG